MKVRIMAFSLLLTLSGCSSLGDWFGVNNGATPISENQIGAISIDTPFSEEGLSLALGANYHLRSGMGMRNNELFSYFQALKEIDDKEQIAQIVYGKYDTGIVKVEVFEPGISTGEASIGTPFSDIFIQAFGACELDRSNTNHNIICQSPKHQNINYVFSGEWNGPEELIPDNEALKVWKVSKIIWNKPIGGNQANDKNVEEAAADNAELDQIGALVESLEQSN